jgi:hypothetical protein
LSVSTLYAIDANVLITASNLYYAFDLAPHFWDQLASHGAAGRICTIDRIADEIKPGPIRDWLNASFSPCVRKTDDAETLAYYAALMQWAQEQPFKEAARSQFARVADPWLVAYAKTSGAVVVTLEVYNENCISKVQMPNACKFLGVPYVDTFQMLRALNVKLGASR